MNRDQSVGTAPLVQLRHEAGLTAGLVMPLEVGAFQFGPMHDESEGLGTGQPEAVRFELTVESSERIFVSRGAEPLAVEGIPVTDRIAVQRGEVIQLATDHFAVETNAAESDLTPRSPLRVPRVPSPDVAGPEWLGLVFGLVIVVSLVLSLVRVGFLTLAVAGAVGLFIVFLARYLRLKREEKNRAELLAAVKNSFTVDLRVARAAATRDLRNAFPGPAGISDIASGRRPTPAAFDGKVAIASGDRGWKPPIEDQAQPGWDHGAVVAQHDFLPAVPLTVDITQDTIGVVGPRQSALAAARHLLTASMSLTDRSQLRITVAAAEDRQANWAWLVGHDSAGPPMHEIHLFDGIVPPSSGPGFVVLAESVDELGVECGTTLIIRDDGSAMAEIAWHGSASGLVPYGITERHARSIVAALANARPAVQLAPASPAPGDPANDLAFEAESAIAELTTDAVLDLTLEPSSLAFRNERLMVVGEPGENVTALIASAALAHATDHPDRPIFVLDRGDRSLIRLAQLPSCRRYAAVDDIVSAAAMIQQLEELETTGPALLVVSDLDRALAFYRRAGVPDLAGRLESLLDDRSKPVYAAASTCPATHDLSNLVERFLVFVFATADDCVAAGGLRLIDEEGEHWVDDSSIAGRDLTGSVAACKFGRLQTRRAL